MIEKLWRYKGFANPLHWILVMLIYTVLKLIQKVWIDRHNH